MTLLQFSRFFLYASVFCVDIVLASTFFPFIGGKYYFFRFAVELSLIFLVLAWALEERHEEIETRVKRLLRQPIFWAVSAFALSFLLASIFAYDPRAAFWSNYERGEGGFQMLHYYAFFVLLALLLEKKEEWMTLFKASIAAAVFMIFYGIGSAALIGNFVGPYGTASQPVAPTFLERLFHPNLRFNGSLGNAAYVAPYLMFSLFYTFWLWISSRRTLWTNIGYGTLTTLFVLFFFLTQTRGAFLGLIAATVAFLVFLIFTARPKWRNRSLAALALLIVAGGLLYSLKSTPFIKGLPGARLLDINFTEETAQTRFWTWRSAWEGFKERPIFGWGPENFSTVFDRHFDTRHFAPGRYTETWFDRAHSVIFDYLAETGILGLLSYLSMFVVFFWQLWKKVLSRREHDSPREPAAHPQEFGIHASAALRGMLAVVLVGYLVQGLILFDVLPIFINVLIVLAFAAVLFKEPHHGRHA